MDPCIEVDCAENAYCDEVSNHTAICICDSDYPFGDPHQDGCTDQGKQSQLYC